MFKIFMNIHLIKILIFNNIPKMFQREKKPIWFGMQNIYFGFSFTEVRLRIENYSNFIFYYAKKKKKNCLIIK